VVLFHKIDKQPDYLFGKMGNLCCVKADELDQAYHNATDENTPTLTFDDIKQKCKVLRIIDGDTVDIAFYHKDIAKLYKYRLRLYGIDTPEKRPSLTSPTRDAEMAAARRASQALMDRLEETGYIIVIHFHKKDKYGRLMGTLYDKAGLSINNWLIVQGYATPYFGGKKVEFDSSKLERVTVGEITLE
jgi:endonuclease YncB( thermonuclease family)